MAELVVLGSDGTTGVVPVESRVSLGRSREAAIHYPADTGLSREHLAVRREGNLWVVEDLGSKNGSFLNGQRLTVKQVLRTGDKITASKVSLTFYEDKAPAGALTAAAEPAGALTGDITESSLLEVLSGDIPYAAPTSGKKEPWVSPLQVAVRIGRGLSERRDLDELYRFILDLALESVGAAAGAVFLIEDGRLAMKASSKEGLTLSQTVRHEVLEKRRSVLARDVQEDDLLKNQMSIVARGITSLMAVPLQTDAKVIGLIYVESPFGVGQFDQGGLSLLTVLANAAALRIELEEYNQNLERMVERRTAELRDSNFVLEGALRSLTEAQDRMVMQEKMASLGNLAAGITHEINTPLGALKSNIQIMARSAAKAKAVLAQAGESGLAAQAPTVGRLLESVVEIGGQSEAATERISRIVKGLKSFSRLDRAEVDDIDIHEGIESTLALLQHLLGDRVRVEKQYNDLPLLRCRPSDVNQVFMNIILNAIQAIDGPGEIRIRTELTDGFAAVTITDSGSGIAPENLSHIFDPGYTTKGVGVGTGLGLAIVHRIVEEHKGRIEVDSDLGQGTTFRVLLPFQSGL